MKKATNYLASALVAAAILIGSNAKAQTTDKSAWRLGIGVEAGIPTGNNITQYSNFELGGTARLQYGLSNKVALTLTSGYYNFFGKEVTSTTNTRYQSIGIVPAKVGIKAFFLPNIYVGGEVGAGFETRSGAETKLLLSPALGWANQHWDVGVRYENFSGQSNDFGVVGLRLAYGFGL